MQNVPSFQEAKKFIVNRPNAEEVIRQSFYDSGEYAAAGFTSQRFFQVPQGQSGKTEQDTNMTLAGQLPQPQFHLTESIELHVFPGENPVLAADAVTTPNFANDVYSILSAGSLTLHIGSKDFLEEAPLLRFPPKTRLCVNFGAALHYTEASASDAAREIVGNYAAAEGRPYFLDPPILIPPTQNFDIQLKYKTLVPTPSTNAARVVVVMDGLLFRLSQ